MDGCELGIGQVLDAEAGTDLHEVLQREGVEEAEEDGGQQGSHEEVVVERIVLLLLLPDVEDGGQVQSQLEEDVEDDEEDDPDETEEAVDSMGGVDERGDGGGSSLSVFVCGASKKGSELLVGILGVIVFDLLPVSGQDGHVHEGGPVIEGHLQGDWVEVVGPDEAVPSIYQEVPKENDQKN